MTRYRTSNGEFITKHVIDSRVRKAKEQVINNQLEEYGYNFCVKCGKSTGIRLDCSHIKSVDWCQKNGCCELAYDVNNIEVLCREHHEERDKLNLIFK